MVHVVEYYMKMYAYIHEVHMLHMYCSYCNNNNNVYYKCTVSTCN